MNEIIGTPVVRSDALAKVTGAARYAADVPRESDTCYAALTLSEIALGHVVRLDTSAAEAVPGVRLVLTHRSPEAKITGKGPPWGGQFQSSANPLASAEIRFAGQILAMTVADTPQGAAEAAGLISAECRSRAAVVALDQALGEQLQGDAVQTGPAGAPPAGGAGEATAVEAAEHSLAVGDTTAALRAAPVVVEADYHTPAMHHQPMELYAVTAQWQGDEQLTVHAPVQWLQGHRTALATAFALPPESVRVVSPLVGGGFGSKATVLWHIVLVASAARRLGRPVKLVVPRRQMFTVGSFRPQTRQRVTLGADREGRLLGYRHRGWHQTSRFDPLLLPGAEMTTRFYDVPALHTRESSVPVDVNTPGYMRAPGEFPAAFALESAMDELATALDLDPMELRLRNQPDRDPVTKVPFSSRAVDRCYRRGAALFGWSERDPQVGSMRDGDGWLLGWGCATSGYPTYQAPAMARVRLTADGRAEIGIGAHELGTGATTVLGQISAETLGLPLAAVTVQVGGSDLPAGPMAGGSITTASGGSAVQAACQTARERLLATAAGLPGWRDPAALRVEDGQVVGPDGVSRPVGEVVATLPGSALEVAGRWDPPGLSPRDAAATLRGEAMSLAGPVNDSHATFSWGAQFVEVRVDPATRRVRLGRMVGVFDVGRVVNPRTVRNQLVGGMIWGAGHALLEESPVDRQLGRFTATDLNSYHLATHADVGEVTVETVESPDELVNPLGIKGVGELGIVGTSAAIANAVYHATGVRVRKTPILIDDLLSD